MSTSRIDDYRRKDVRLVAGVMSGTSLDGIDVAFVEISGSGREIRHLLLGFHSFPYEPGMRSTLMAASAGELGMRAAYELDADLGGVYAEAIASAATAAGIGDRGIDAVGLHGQTVYHAPARRPHGVTVQIGSAAVVAGYLDTIVVNDFRAQDVAVGGEGAPLVPYCDLVLLHSPSLNRVALNIGGIANVTWLPSGADAATLVAFDTGPGNMLIDAAMRELFGRDRDENGAIASKGRVDEEWVEVILTDGYFSASPPKSTGRELFGAGRAAELLREGRERGLGDADIVASLTLLSARSIARGIESFASRGEQVEEIVAAGGGVRNLTLMNMLHQEMPSSRVLSSDVFGIPADAKEAICFAILANEALCETPANVPSVTGARRPVVCGALRLP